MWLEFFKFDLRFQLRQPLLWVIALIFGALAFGAASSDAITVGGAVGNVNRNAPTVIAQFLCEFSVLSMFVVTIFIAGAILRDAEIGISDMLFATPMRKHDYLIGRFLAGLVACLVIFLFVILGLLVGPYMPWVDTARVGTFMIQPFVWGLLVFVIPNLLFIGALLMLLAATTRSMMMVYVGVIGFFVLWVVAGAFTRDINNEWVAALLDPFGLRAFGRMTRYFSTAESNAILPALNGFLIMNRLLWSVIGIALFTLTLVLFKPQRAGTGRRWFGKTKLENASQAATPQLAKVSLPKVMQNSGNATAWIQFWNVLKFDTKAVFKSVPFLVMLLFGLVNFIGSASLSEVMFGTTVYPVTTNMLTILAGSFNFMLIIIVTFYAGELIFKERQVKIADVVDAMPVPNWVPLMAKSAALTAVILSFLSAGAITGVVMQLIKGGAPIELSLYVKGVLLGASGFILLGLLALVLQVLTNNKFIGYLMMILVMISQVVFGTLDLDHNLYNFAGSSATPYSDMNGYGHFLNGWSWFTLYWSLFTVALLIVAQAFWVRGLSQEWRVRARLAMAKLNSKAGLALALSLTAFVFTGGWIFYNTNVLNQYQTKTAELDEKAEYEKKYKQYKNLPHPRLTDVKASVDIYPEQRKVIINGHYVLQNKSALPQDTLRIQINTIVKTEWKNLPAHELVLDDKKIGFSIVKLKQALAAGESLALDFVTTVENPGFTNSGAANTVNLNGTFFNNREFFPQFGYASGAEMRDRNERRKRGLGEPERMPKLEDESARAYHALHSEADWINFDTTISTSADQIAMAPGYLQKSWEENGRRYFHYKMDRPMMPYFAFLSARWEVKKGDWKGLPIEIYYDKKHAYNVDRMIESTKKSLDYFTSNFTPYQHQQVRILEFPRYASFAQSFANTIPYSEAIGFIADLRDKDDIDYVFYVTAHEMAHQWWGHQVIGANMQGSTVLTESLSQYFALMVMEKEYGREKMRRFLRYELDGYLRGRGGELIEEQPLARVEGQQYIHYQKGSLIFYRLRDEIGEDALNRALKRFLQDKAYQQAPYTTTKELLTYIREAAPQDKHALIADMFEKIVFYDNRVTEAKAVKRTDGQWDVTMKLHLAKIQVDGKGKETPRTYDEAVEIAIFSRAPGAKEKDEKVLFIEKRVLQGNAPSVTITVKDKPFEVGVDPYNKMIDRVSKDNRKEVSVE
nr:M1 family aminopeptidase [uncultured Undibacterium sp.]